MIKIIDYLSYEDKVRKVDSSYMQSILKKYADQFKDCTRVLDIACGKGEFLALLKESNVNAIGIDSDNSIVEYATSQGLCVIRADVFEYLESNTKKFDGIFCSQFIEHLSPEDLIKLFRYIYKNLNVNGIAIITTPNPRSLIVHLQSFYRDFSHRRFYDIDLIKFIAELHGFEVTNFGEDKDTSFIVPLMKHEQSDIQDVLSNLDHEELMKRIAKNKSQIIELIKNDELESNDFIITEGLKDISNVPITPNHMISDKDFNNKKNKADLSNMVQDLRSKIIQLISNYDAKDFVVDCNGSWPKIAEHKDNEWPMWQFSKKEKKVKSVSNNKFKIDLSIPVNQSFHIDRIKLVKQPGLVNGVRYLKDRILFHLIEKYINNIYSNIEKYQIILAEEKARYRENLVQLKTKLDDQDKTINEQQEIIYEMEESLSNAGISFEKAIKDILKNYGDSIKGNTRSMLSIIDTINELSKYNREIAIANMTSSLDLIDLIIIKEKNTSAYLTAKISETNKIIKLIFEDFDIMDKKTIDYLNNVIESLKEIKGKINESEEIYNGFIESIYKPHDIYIKLKKNN